MLKITILVDRPTGQAIGVKEQIAQELEKYGDTTVISVEEIKLKQTSIPDMGER